MEKVLITSRSFGKASREPFEILEAAGIAYDMMGADYSNEKFSARIVDYDALIIGGHMFEPGDMERCKKLKIIAKHGAGLDNINLNKAKAQGITVTNVPAMNSDAVADLTFALVLNVCRGVSLTNSQVREGKWKIYIGRDVHAKTLGLIGFGAIARAVAKRAVGFSMKVLACDPFVKEVPEELRGFVTLCDFDTAVSKSDIVSIHAPINKETTGMFDKNVLARMKKDAVLVNTGRGGIVNESDLYECMKAGHLFGAALDVTAAEPIEKDNPLLTLDNVIITPHIGMYSVEAVSAVSIVCANNVVKKLSGQTPEFVIV